MNLFSRHRSTGFSLIEVTLAIGITAFALIAIVGLIPTGLRSTQEANDQARATEVLKLAATAIRGQYYLGTSGSPTVVTNYSFANYLSTQDPAAVAGDTSSPWNLHTKYFTTQSPWTFTFSVLNDVSIQRSTDTTSIPRYKLFMQVYPPADINAPLRVYLSAAWPGAATHAGTTWVNAQGYVEATVYANVPSPK